MKIWTACLFLTGVFSTAIGARESVQLHPTPAEGQLDPWLTGPLLAPSGHTVPKGHVNYEPYIYWSTISRRYDKNWNSYSVSQSTSILGQATMQIGVANATEFDLAPQIYWNHSSGRSSLAFGDLPITLAFQVLNDQKEEWWPAIKLRFAANIPWGKFQKLSSHKNGTDAGGNGNWSPAAGLIFSRLFHFHGACYLAARYFLSYVVSTPVHVKGINVYGGTKQTHGTIYPGNSFQTDLGLELSLTHNWVIATDILYVHNNKIRFSGHSRGPTLRSPSSEQISLAPALEYNWNANLGLIGGVWLTVAGRNSAKFTQGVIAFNVYR